MLDLNYIGLLISPSKSAKPYRSKLLTHISFKIECSIIIIKQKKINSIVYECVQNFCGFNVNGRTFLQT